MVYVVLADGFEETEAVVPVDILRRGGVEVKFAAVNSMTVKGSHGISVNADIMLADADPDREDMVFVPGGLKAVDAILNSKTACDFLKTAKERDCRLSAICAGPTVLSRLGLIDGKKAVCFPGMEDLLPPAISCPGEKTVVDGRLITGQAAGAAFEMGVAMLAALKGEETADKTAKAIYWKD